MSKEKISQAQVGEMLKLAGQTIEAQGRELESVKQKLAHYEKQERAMRIAEEMQAKHLQPELALKDKVAFLMKRDDLDVFERAVDLQAPQMKLASVADDQPVGVQGEGGERAASNFEAALFSIAESN